MIRLLVAFFAIALLPVEISAQQRADSRFTAHIERPAYPGGGPAVAIDQSHRNFHTLTGTYAPFGQLLLADGYRPMPFTGSFTAASLKDVGVLVIADARGPNSETSAFGSDEIAAVRDWVAGGGSLFLISDHVPFGTAASRLAEAFGVNMGAGFVVARSSGRVSSQILFNKSNLGRHLILDGRDASERVGSVRSFTGQSLSVPAGAVPLLTLPSDALEVASADKAQELSHGGRVPARSAAGRAQAVALSFGKGRVVVAGEAAMFTEQLIPGLGREGLRANDNQQFTLNVMHWLTRLIG